MTSTSSVIKTFPSIYLPHHTDSVYGGISGFRIYNC